MNSGTLALAGAITFGAVLRRTHLSTAMRVIVALVVAGLAVSGIGLVELPRAETLVREATASLGSLTYVVVGAFAFAETGAFIGLVAPGELVVVLGGVSAGHGTISLPTLIVVVWLCALGGDLVSYGLGRHFGREFLVTHGGALGITDARVSRMERVLADHAGKTIVLGRFVGLVRPLTPFLVGAARTPARRFVPMTALASGLWSATFCGLGYAFWESLDELLSLIERGSLGLGAALALAAAVVLVRRRVHGARGARGVDGPAQDAA